MATILVTGGAGFIGSHLCEYLLNKGNEVICLDNFFTGSKKNVGHLLDNENFEIIRHDIIRPIYLEVDQIYNLACPASPVHYQWDPIKTLLTSTVGMYNLLGMAKRCKSRILQASTSEVYGDPKEHPQKETYWGNVNTIGPRSCYDEGKRVAESFMIDYNKENNVDIRIARIFNTYGPNMAKNDGRVVSNFIVQALKDEPITVYGDGSQTRSFCYVSDMVEGLYRLMNSDFKEPLNLGNPHELSVIDIADKIKVLTNSNSEIIFKDLPVDDPIMRCPDISRAKKILNWKPKIKLEGGLKKTIEYFKKLEIKK
ncbi:NAD-dependent dehydratase [Candidatus Atribacteria bacterium HGW-Atribacteria-1]|nr:MAG: NAD-dependent dehydratase [Candidatus Atribacteria bacterium HGW-Atribacteria-1]